MKGVYESNFNNESRVLKKYNIPKYYVRRVSLSEYDV